jgi:diguanylate cyclase (GGDEF)-like protein/PAS domain S-box-containing protein
MMDVIRDILINIILLFGLVFIISLSNSRIQFKHKWMNVSFGMVIGLVTIIIMLNAWEMQTGVFFDTRSVMIGVTSLFFSYSTSLIAAIIAIAYRIYLGGSGALAGSLSIFSALIIGWIWKYYIYQKIKMNKYLSFYLFGLFIHIFVILSQFAQPYPQSIQAIRNVGLIILIAFPIATMLLSIAVLNHEERIQTQQMIVLSEKKYRSLIDNSKLGIIQYNKDGVIEIANEAFASILTADVKDLMGLNMLDLPNKELVEKVKESLSGELSIFEGYYESYLTKKKFPGRSQFSPILENDEVIGGIGIIEDLSQEYESKQRINELTHFDNLTDLFNRTTFDIYILNQKNLSKLPISIIIFDVNSLQIINTSFGYDIGNKVLSRIAQSMKETLKDNKSSNLFRIGGDEFACIMPLTTREEAEEIAKDIKDKVKEIEDFDFTISLSYGVDTSVSSNQALSETYNQALINMSSNKIYDGSSISMKTIDLIMGTLFEKSKREKMHSERVSQIAKEIAKLYNLGTAFINRVELAGRLHDIGKINISEDILDKPGKLNDQEWKKILKHPESGFRILSTVPEYLDIANIVLTHHERYDGKGYPRGISGHNIPLESRIISLADAYDAMTELRTYRMPLTEDQAIEEIILNKDKQFDPEVVDKFLFYKNQIQ